MVVVVVVVFFLNPLPVKGWWGIVAPSAGRQCRQTPHEHDNLWTHTHVCMYVQDSVWFAVITAHVCLRLEADICVWVISLLCPLTITHLLWTQSFKNLVAKKKRLIVLFSHWLLHAYGIISISRLDKLEQDLPLLALVPGPALFYIVTAKFTEPSRILLEAGNGHWAGFIRSSINNSWKKVTAACPCPVWCLEIVCLFLVQNLSQWGVGLKMPNVVC